MKLKSNFTKEELLECAHGDGSGEGSPNADRKSVV